MDVVHEDVGAVMVRSPTLLPSSLREDQRLASDSKEAVWSATW